MTEADPKQQKPQQKGNTGFLRVVKAAGYSTQGVKAAWQHESAFRQELTSGIVLLPLAYWLGVGLDGGLTWAWAGGVIEVALLSGTLIWRFRTGAWKQIVI